jgi:hypothetical protein
VDEEKFSKYSVLATTCGEKQIHDQVEMSKNKRSKRQKEEKSAQPKLNQNLQKEQKRKQRKPCNSTGVLVKQTAVPTTAVLTYIRNGVVTTSSVGANKLLHQSKSCSPRNTKGHVCAFCCSNLHQDLECIEYTRTKTCNPQPLVSSVLLLLYRKVRLVGLSSFVLGSFVEY